MRNGIVNYFESLANEPSLSSEARQGFKSAQWLYCKSTNSWYGNPGRSAEVRNYLKGLEKKKRRQGKSVKRSLPLSYQDLKRIFTFYDDPDCKSEMNDYQRELIL
jgi:hypothetical protein